MTNVDDALILALDPLFPDRVFPNVYTGDALEYVVTNYTAIPQVFAERQPAAQRYLVAVHYYLPDKINPNPKKLAISNVLFGQGFTWPSIENASDSEGQHWVFECEYVNGGGVYGQT